MSQLPGVPLSVLDLLPVSVTQTAADSLAATQAVARVAEELGYRRYWIGEHHNTPTVASAFPPLVIAAVGAVTSRIRIGSGPVHLPNHSPYVVAEQFGTLNALFGDRVDIGVGRSIPDDPRVAEAVRGGTAPEAPAFEARFDDLVSYLRGLPAAGDDGAEPVRAYPHYTAAPPLWAHGSTLATAEFAAERGFPLVFLHYFKPDVTEQALRLYRENFRPSQYAARPYVTVVASVLCAAADEQAQWLADPAAVMFANVLSGTAAGPLPTPEQAEAHDWTGPHAEFKAAFFAEQAVGAPDTVRKRLAGLLERTRADELMAVNLVTDTGARSESLRLLRGIFPG
jgi:luciferase family oxidoreductase group 1